VRLYKIEITNPNESESVARVVYRSTELATKSPAIGRPQGTSS